MEVILVGSSSNLLKTKKGSIIDTFEEIVRFNRAPTTGFEKHVGSKTTVRFCNPHVFLNNEFEGQDMEFIPNLTNQKIITPLSITDYEFYRMYDSSCKYEIIDRKQEYSKCMEKYSEKINLDLSYQGHEPSLGLVGVCYYLNKNLVPTIYGFDVESQNYLSSPHYWWNKTKIGGYHNFEYERKILKNFLKEGIIKKL